ncbi:MAG: aldehyde dehydrogenase family protein, partial [Planctomycetaceae bacterium]
TQYGLTGALFSRDRFRLERARHEFHVGNLYLNRKCTGALVDVQPFGGFNMSGTDSKAGGRDYLQLFLQGKSITERY